MSEIGMLRTIRSACLLAVTLSFFLCSRVYAPQLDPEFFTELSKVFKESRPNGRDLSQLQPGVDYHEALVPGSDVLRWPRRQLHLFQYLATVDGRREKEIYILDQIPVERFHPIMMAGRSAPTAHVYRIWRLQPSTGDGLFLDALAEVPWGASRLAFRGMRAGYPEVMPLEKIIDTYVKPAGRVQEEEESSMVQSRDEEGSMTQVQDDGGSMTQVHDEGGSRTPHLYNFFS
ncbi:hypothetical protein BCV70DRAFT_217543 [Testicularia cyperi]|uniref:Uncharacterized protein n=1 Tax=Testicularia cyperi TaxID=1882483 RepID=A0A317XP05_9BASI|nr:hypothetical protein BCV70DRAFT_217543 [Testicularia cyperi]